MSLGKFITVEGIDGCGKSTQLKKIAEYYEEMGREVIFIREPGGTKIGEKIRGVLLDKKNDSMVPMAELLLYEAARAQITEEIIRPALNEGKIVLSDRFFDSTTAYQGCARDLGFDLTSSLNEIATGGLKPDITFIFDISPEEAYKRRTGRGEAEDRIEAMGLGFQEKVREGYLKINEPRVKVIDASNTPEEIFEQVKVHLAD